MKDGDRATITKIDDVANPSEDKGAPLNLVKIIDKREGERRSRGERRYFHSSGADDPERRTLSRRAWARRASDEIAIDKENGDKE
ncbi:MAG: hypothetical protein H0U72_01365 [Nitrosospira sp.]|nr:hypothetical protein [Nitrosospira sp.]